MAYCPRCGVEVEGKKCPLCMYTIQKDIHKKPFSHKVELEKKVIKIDKKEKKNIYNVSTIFFSILVSSVCLTLDYISDSDITWAVYPVISVGTMSCITSAALYTKGILRIILFLIISLIMLFLIDYFIPVTNFFLIIALPISGIGVGLEILTTILIKKSQGKGANVGGFIVIAVTLFTIAVDVIIHNYIYRELALTWSLITTVALLPIAIFLLYIHYILSKRINLKKIFHT